MSKVKTQQKDQDCMQTPPLYCYQKEKFKGERGKKMWTTQFPCLVSVSQKKNAMKGKGKQKLNKKRKTRRKANLGKLAHTNLNPLKESGNRPTIPASLYPLQGQNSCRRAYHTPQFTLNLHPAELQIPLQCSRAKFSFKRVLSIGGYKHRPLSCILALLWGKGQSKASTVPR